MTQITASRQRAVCVRRTVSRKLRSLYHVHGVSASGPILQPEKLADFFRATTKSAIFWFTSATFIAQLLLARAAEDGGFNNFFFFPTLLVWPDPVSCLLVVQTKI